MAFAARRLNAGNRKLKTISRPISILFLLLAVFIYGMKKIRRCIACSKFTLEEECCGAGTKGVHPPRYNPHDKYAYIRRGEKSA